MCTVTQPTCNYQLANTALKFIEDEGDTLSQDISSRKHRHSIKDETGIHKMSAAKRGRAEGDRKKPQAIQKHLINVVTFKFDFHVLKKENTISKVKNNNNNNRLRRDIFNSNCIKLREKLVYRIQTPTQYKDCKGRVDTKLVILIMVGEEQREIRMGQATEAHI